MALTDNEIEQLIEAMKRAPELRTIEVYLRDNVTEKPVTFGSARMHLYVRPVAGDYLHTERFEDEGDRYHPRRKYYRAVWLVERVALTNDSNDNPDDIIAYVVKIRESEVV